MTARARAPVSAEAALQRLRRVALEGAEGMESQALASLVPHSPRSPATPRPSRSTRRLVAPRAHDPHRTHAQDSGFTFSNGLTVHFQSGFAHRHQVHASSTSPSRAARH